MEEKLKSIGVSIDVHQRLKARLHKKGCANICDVIKRALDLTKEEEINEI